MRAPRPVRFTTAEVEAVQRALNALQITLHERHPVVTASRKLDAAVAERPAVTSAVSVRDAVAAMEGVLGAGRVVLPPHPDDAWFARVTRYLRERRLTAEDFVRMARAIQNKGWAPPFSFERTMYASDRLLAEEAVPTSARLRKPAEMDGL